MNENLNTFPEQNKKTTNSKKQYLVITTLGLLVVLLGIALGFAVFTLRETENLLEKEKFNLEIALKTSEEMKNTLNICTEKQELLFSNFTNYANIATQGDDVIIGSPERLNDTKIAGFGVGDSVFVEGVLFDMEDVQITSTSSGLLFSFDVNQDRETDFSMTFQQPTFGFLYEKEFFVTEHDNGNTIMEYVFDE